MLKNQRHKEKFWMFIFSLSEYSDENMMDAYNLSICYGPTLLPIPPDRDQVSYQSNVHEVIKTIIIHQEDIFPFDGQGAMYEKCILEMKFVSNMVISNLFVYANARMFYF